MKRLDQIQGIQDTDSVQAVVSCPGRCQLRIDGEAQIVQRGQTVTVTGREFKALCGQRTLVLAGTDAAEAILAGVTA
jgi:hypothetical protein